MLLCRREDHVELLANALGAALESVAAELRLIDAGDFIAFIHDEKFANIQDIVNSWVELFFRPGAVSFGWGAEYELDWNSSPVISFDIVSSRLGVACLQTHFAGVANGSKDRVSFARKILGGLRAGHDGAYRSVK